MKAVTDLPDYDLLKADEPVDLESPPRPRLGLWIAVAVLAVAAGVASYVVFSRRGPAPPQTAAVAPPPAQAPAQPLGGQPEAVNVPPLGESDPIVRELVRQISAHPTVAAWLATNGLIRNFTVDVANIVEGKTPAPQLGALKPSASFQVMDRNGERFIDPRSYERYNNLAAAAASIDPDGAARVYATLKPRIEEAYAELGVRPAAFDQALERAIVVLLQTPVVDRPIRVEPKGIGYAFADPALENLTGAQKQLLRMGPANMRTVQAALRRVALALGIPAERLPATT
jgi:hypothetical protein